jgi:ATP/maltotriose-dependent transcriptional regulator MalT
MDRYAEGSAYLERALLHAEGIGDRLSAARAAGTLGFMALFGPLPVDEAIARCHELRPRAGELASASASLLRFEAVLRAMRGEIDEARSLHDRGDRIADDVGLRWLVANAAFTRAILELLAGAPVRAERAARAGLDAFEAMHNRSQGSTAAALVALALVEQHRDDEALELADLAAAWAAPDDAASQVLQFAVRARVLAGRGDQAAAEAAARRGVALSLSSDDLTLRGDALEALAIVLERSGRPEEATRALSDALAVHARKGNVVAVRRLQLRSASRPAP